MTKIRDIKERELVSIITSLLNLPDSDDCAVIPMAGSEHLVASTDMLHQSTDFPAGMTPWQMGWMSVAVNLSDIAAMGARPLGVLAALGLPPDLEIDAVTGLVEGMRACADAFGTRIIGGDVDRHAELTVVGTALGMVDRADLILRTGARVGDRVCVTGELGTAGAALDALQRGVQVDPELVRKLYQPTPRIMEGNALARTGCITSMMDISDGLALSLHDLAHASGVGFSIVAEDIPIHRSVRAMAADQALEWSIYTGGDFELLFTVNPGCMEKAREVARFTVIGTVMPEGITMQRNGEAVGVEARGFQQFGDTL